MRSGLFPMLVPFAVALAVLAPARAAERRAPRSHQAPPAQITSGDTTWERVPVRYVDVRVVAAALGAPVLPTEWEVWQMKMGGRQFGGGPMGGGGLGGAFGGGGFQGGFLGDRNSNSLLFGPNSGYRPGILFADPNTNAVYFQYGPPR